MIVLAACANSGAPEALDDQLGALPDSVPASALAEGQDPNAVPLFERNFLEGCVTGGRAELLEELRGVQAEALPVVCGCIYRGFEDHFVAAATAELSADGATPTGEELDRRAYELFDGLDEAYRKDAETTLRPELVDISAECIRSSA